MGKGATLARARARVAIRQMVIEDLPEVWHIGEKAFVPSASSYTYQTWNVDELVAYFHGDPELCLVAEDSATQKILGFALGTMLKRPYSPWTYDTLFGVEFERLIRKVVWDIAFTGSWKRDLRRGEPALS